ncbi:MAG: DNA topoisomerase IV subunit A [Rhodospirillales bacterium]|nr:DNA topoisomerase IV subunit A [Rhodospirillales bacterium]
MASAAPPPPAASEPGIDDVPLVTAITERYLTYAVSTIVGRSLPDARDGLKPVHRRLLWAMRQLRLDPGSGFKKCARVVGDVIGRYHPHGDVAVYEALVRLAQDFAVRWPLVEGQGNFGNIDGDGPAAMRYTEARLTDVAEALLEGIDEDAVDFRPTYDGEDDEPVVLPAAFPNLLANGASGIAVGMATSIPPHNAAEICAAAVHLIQHPDASLEELMARLPGPDFPTGGVLVEDAATRTEVYRSGRGSLRLRARWAVEKSREGTVIVVSEIPWQVQKGKLIERLADLLAERKLPFLADVRDESTETVRLVLKPRGRPVDAEAIMAELFRLTDLEVRVGVNLNVLVDGTTPRVLGLKDLLRAWLSHRREVLRRRSLHRRGRIEQRLELLAGFLIVHLNLDEVIRIVREEDDPKAALMARFGINEVQADAVLNMRLRQLRKLEEIVLITERDGLLAERAGLDALLADEGLLWRRIAEEVAAVGTRFGPDTPLGRRRTTIAAAPLPVAVLPQVAAAAAAQPVTVLCSEKGWVRAAAEHLDEEAAAAVRYKEGDGPRFAVHASTADKLLILGSQGRIYTLPCDRLPSGRGFGEPLRLLIELPPPFEAQALRVYRPAGRLLIASDAGRGFLVDEDAVLGQTRTGKAVLAPGDGEQAVFLQPVAPEDDSIAVVGSNRRLLVFPLAELPVMAKGRGVLLQRYRDARLGDVVTFAAAHGLSWKSGRGMRTETDLRPYTGKRGQIGHTVPRGFPASGRFAG